MSDFKFKEGDLVEILISKRGRGGHRFIVGNFGIKNLRDSVGSDNLNNVKAYETDIASTSGNLRFDWAPENHIRLVKPDFDEISDSTFSEIMDEITEAITVEQ